MTLRRTLTLAMLLCALVAPQAFAAGVITHRFVSPAPPTDNPNDVDSAVFNDSIIISGGSQHQLMIRDEDASDGWRLAQPDTYYPAAADSLADLVTAIGADHSTIVISEPLTLGANVEIPSTTALVVLTQGSIDCDTTRTLTVNGPFSAPPHQVFVDCPSGQVTFPELAPIAHAEWFGAVVDDSTNDATAINATLGALPNGGVLQLLSGQYDLSAALSVRSEQTIQGYGGATLVKAMANFGNTRMIRNATVEPADEASRDHDLVVRDLVMDGNKANNATATEHSHCVMFQAVLRARVEQVTCLSPKGDGIYIGKGDGANTEVSEYAYAIANTVYDCFRNGISVTAGRWIQVSKNVIVSCGLDSIDIEPDLAEAEAANTIIVEGNILAAGDNEYGASVYAAIACVNNNAAATQTNILIKNNLITDHAGYGIDFRHCSNVSIEGNLIKDPSLRGITSVSGHSIVQNHISIRNNEIISPGEQGIVVNAATKVVIQNNQVRAATGASGNGMQLVLLTDALVTGNRVESSAQDGFLIQGVQDSTFAHNFSIDNTVRGFNLTASGGTNSTGNHFTGNRIQGNTSTGMALAASQDSNIIQANYFQGNSAPVSNSGTSNKFRDNTGYVTEASGTGTVANAATTAVVTHGLNVTPAAKDCSVEFTEAPTNATTVKWLGTFTSTQFTLTVNDPGASGLDFGWRCAVY